MPVWFEDGSITGFDPSTLRLKDGVYKFLKLPSQATVDVNGVIRSAGYWSIGWTGQPVPGRLTAFASLTITLSEWNFIREEFAQQNQADAVVVLAFADASEFAEGVAPTPEALLESARRAGTFARSPWRLSQDPPTVANPSRDYHTISTEYDSSGLAPNTKYWVMQWLVQQRLNTTDDGLRPIQWPGGYAGDARIISLWSNRTPKAPVITSPDPDTLVNAGSTFTLTIDDKDPDGFPTAPLNSPGGRDRSGVQVQYAPAPQVGVQPVWTDLPFSTFGGSPQAGPGWFIIGSTHPSLGTNPIPEKGAAKFWSNGTVDVMCGSLSTPPLSGLLPAGDWQIRVRTFDYGHPIPYAVDVGGGVGYPPAYGYFRSEDLTPQKMEVGGFASPWSEPVRVTVPSQVPAPVPLSPVDGTAVSVDTPIAFSWLYRNTAMPPFEQAKYTLQIRRATRDVSGNPYPWVTYENEVAGSTPGVTVDNDLVVNAPYEWRVKVWDTSGYESEWSPAATFWSIPAMNSGPGSPVFNQSLSGATLGCGTHRAFVYRRGGMVRVGEITGIESLDWSRVRDDRGMSQIVVRGWDQDCGNLLAKLQTWAYEIVIFRDNGFSVDRVFEGPITALTYEADSVTIKSQDVIAYLYRRVLRQEMNDARAGVSVTARGRKVIQNALAPDDPNLLSYLTVFAKTDDNIVKRSTPAYSRTAFEELDDLAANWGLDYVAVGRRILLWGTKHRIGTLPEFRDKDLGSSPIVSEYGMSFTNHYIVTNGAGVHGSAHRLDENGTDPVYGLVEMLSSSWSEDAPPESGTFTQDQQNSLIDSYKSLAERALSSRNPPPVVVRVPDNTTLHPDTVVSIQHLVPGVVIPLRSVSTLRTVRANQKLDSVTVSESGGVETVSIVMSPFSRDDAEMGEEVE